MSSVGAAAKQLERVRLLSVRRRRWACPACWGPYHGPACVMRIPEAHARPGIAACRAHTAGFASQQTGVTLNKGGSGGCSR